MSDAPERDNIGDWLRWVEDGERAYEQAVNESRVCNRCLRVFDNALDDRLCDDCKQRELEAKEDGDE